MVERNCIDVEIVQGGMIANVYLDPNSPSFDRNRDTWSQVFPLRASPGMISFNFDKRGLHLLGIQIIYAKLCLDDRFVQYAEYQVRPETYSERFYYDGEFVAYIYLHGRDRKKVTSTQAIGLPLPATGIAVMDFAGFTLVGIELINCAFTFAQ